MFGRKRRTRKISAEGMISAVCAIVEEQVPEALIHASDIRDESFGTSTKRDIDGIFVCSVEINSSRTDIGYYLHYQHKKRFYERRGALT